MKSHPHAEPNEMKLKQPGINTANPRVPSRNSAIEEDAERRLDVTNLRMYACPSCGGGLGRVQRRIVDRLVSAFVSIRRVRCSNFLCGYEGNLRV